MAGKVSKRGSSSSKGSASMPIMPCNGKQHMMAGMPMMPMMPMMPNGGGTKKSGSKKGGKKK